MALKLRNKSTKDWRPPSETRFGVSLISMVSRLGVCADADDDRSTGTCCVVHVDRCCRRLQLVAVRSMPSPVPPHPDKPTLESSQTPAGKCKHLNASRFVDVDQDLDSLLSQAMRLAGEPPNRSGNQARGSHYTQTGAVSLFGVCGKLQMRATHSTTGASSVVARWTCLFEG